MLEKIKEIIAESLGTEISTLTEETSFKEDLGVDSLDLFEMVMALEEAFNVEIPSEDLDGAERLSQPFGDYFAFDTEQEINGAPEILIQRFEISLPL